jgi:hypothetical protein
VVVDLHFSYLLLLYFDSPSITDKEYNQVSQELYYYFFKYIYAVLPFGSLILLIKLARVKDFQFQPSYIFTFSSKWTHSLPQTFPRVFTSKEEKLFFL